MLKVRFAPSPTGFLHIGGARTALFNWIYARKNGGKFILRIEDTDRQRSQKKYLDQILASIKWLNMEWDEIYYQSQRFDIYRRYAEKLAVRGLAYRKDGAIFFKYDFKQIKINDLIRKEVVFNELPKEEEVIIKRDGSPAYNFSCCIDDALMGINCIIRGEDHLSNTPKQVLIYEALGFAVPDFAHLPLILSPAGGRLSKRYGATAVFQYKKEGYLPEALANYFLLLGWSPGGDREILSLDEAKKLFELKDVNKTGAAFSPDKLNWINSQYIRKKDLDELTREIGGYLSARNHPYVGCDASYLKQVAALFKTRLVKLSEFPAKAEFCFSDDFAYHEEARPILDKKETEKIEKLKEELSQIEVFEKQAIESVFRRSADQLGVKAGILVHPCRVALTGRTKGPGLFETMEVLGKKRVGERLDRLIGYWQKK